jgi:hypothetical protein
VRNLSFLCGKTILFSQEHQVYDKSKQSTAHLHIFLLEEKADPVPHVAGRRQKNKGRSSPFDVGRQTRVRLSQKNLGLEGVLHKNVAAGRASALLVLSNGISCSQ